METMTINGAAVSAAHIETLAYLQGNETAYVYCEAIAEVVDFITLADDPRLTLEKQMHLLKTLALIKEDLKALAKID